MKTAVVAEAIAKSYRNARSQDQLHDICFFNHVYFSHGSNSSFHFFFSVVTGSSGSFNGLAAEVLLVQPWEGGCCNSGHSAWAETETHSSIFLLVAFLSSSISVPVLCGHGSKLWRQLPDPGVITNLCKPEFILFF